MIRLAHSNVKVVARSYHRMGIPRVVVVDDSQAARAILTSRLEKAGYAVTAVPDAYAGADLVLQTMPDAVVTDLWMPGMSGPPALPPSSVGPSDGARAGGPPDRVGRSESAVLGRSRRATAFVSKERIEDLLHALAAIAAEANPDPGVTARTRGRGSVQDRRRCRSMRHSTTR